MITALSQEERRTKKAGQGISMSTVQHSHDPHAPESEIVHLSRLSGYQTFGTMLALIRARNGLSQQQIAEASKPYLRSRRMSFDRRMYGRLENDERFPAFAELEPLYRTFVEVFLVAFSEVERELYVQLAQKRLAQKRKKREYIAPEQWDRLAETLAQADHRKRGNIRLVERVEKDQAATAKDGESPAFRRLKAIDEALRTDTSHLLERESWVKEMLSYLNMMPQKKLVVIQGAMGAGKSHAMALLTQQLALQSDLYVLPYRFEQGEDTTPDDQLAIFLATVLSDLLQAAPDETKQRSLEERIDQVLAALRERGERGQKNVLLLDDTQVIFPSALEWSAAWERFFQSFTREPHTATIYLATRIWPGWMDRRYTYLEETDLPELSPEAGVVMWQRFGFSDVPEAVLRQASRRCGGNPQLIELRASHLQRRSFAFAWGKGGQVRSRSTTTRTENTARLEAFLEQDSIFDPKSDIEARGVLQQVISNRLSHQASRMLECLACSPLGLPSTLLEQEFPHADLVYDELVRASLVDLSMAASDRAAVAPLVREAQLQALLSDGRRESIEQRITDLYDLWLTTLQDFRDDAEKSALIAEMVVRYIRQRQLLKAAELFIGYGWLCAIFGHVARIQRVFEEYIRDQRGKTEDARHEVGRLLLLHRISIHTERKIARSERDRIYQSIYDKVIAGEITLQSHAELEVLQNMLLLYTRNGQLTEASQMFDRTLERLRHAEQMTPEGYASFLFSKARLMSNLSEHTQHPTEALRFIQASANALAESIANWRQCLKNALPLQEHYVKFRLARALNDYANDLRTLGHVSEAQEAVEESIQIKKTSGALPHSLAISLSEYSQILASQGRIRQALSTNEEAIQLLEQAIENGDASHHPELGMLLVERANILWLQARLLEAKPLLERAVELIGDKPSRQQDKNRAIAQLEEIRLITSSSRPYQLDRRWFPRFHELVNYDDLALLAQAGPFNVEEQAEWEALASRQNHDESEGRLLELIARTRKREFACSLEENRPPIIWYQRLPLALDDIRERIGGLASLYKEIEAQETNAVVRRLYLDAIDEHLTILRLCEATALQDQEAVWQANLKLYGKPSLREFKIALQLLCSSLLEARHHQSAGATAEEALAQLRAWGISPHEIAAEELFIPKQEATQQRNHKALAGEKRMFPTTIVKRFFQDVFAMYGADDYEVSISPARDHTYVDTNVLVLVLPETSFSVAKIRQLLAEEIETHAYRAIAGRHSPLALLGSGLARHFATEEGLAFHYVQRVNQLVNGETKVKTWNGTLAPGLAAGILTPALSFQELRAFFEKVFLVDKLLNDCAWEEAFASARQSAWARASRTFRGIPFLDQAGYCSLKDRIYLEGYLEVSRYLDAHGDEQRLNVGSIGIQHLEDMAELGILAPNYQHQHLALAPHLVDHLAKYELNF